MPCGYSADCARSWTVSLLPDQIRYPRQALNNIVICWHPAVLAIGAVAQQCGIDKLRIALRQAGRIQSQFPEFLRSDAVHENIGICQQPLQYLLSLGCFYVDCNAFLVSVGTQEDDR